jgi:hypothetical protein
MHSSSISSSRSDPRARSSRQPCTQSLTRLLTRSLTLSLPLATNSSTRSCLLPSLTRSHTQLNNSLHSLMARADSHATTLSHCSIDPHTATMAEGSIMSRPTHRHPSLHGSDPPHVSMSMSSSVPRCCRESVANFAEVGGLPPQSVHGLLGAHGLWLLLPERAPPALEHTKQHWWRWSLFVR